MIVRSAYLEGTVAETDRASFEFGCQRVVEAIRAYPRIHDVRLRYKVRSEENAPPVCAIFDLYFGSLEDMDAALASETRQLVRSTIAEAISMFRGRVYHLVLDEDAGRTSPL
jgi:predicted transcriptional regulator